MELTDIITLQLKPEKGFELVPEEIAPQGKWVDMKDHYELTGMVKDVIGLPINLRRIKKKTATINVVSNNNDYGQASGGGEYPIGEKIKISAKSNKGYHLIQWNDGIKDEERGITVKADATYIATFAPDVISYTINVAVKKGQENWGKTEGGGSMLPAGSVTGIAAWASEGYKFVKWNDGSTQNERTVPVDANKTYTAEFAVDTVKLNVVANNASWGRTGGGGIYARGTVIEIYASENPGYRFIQWNDSNPDKKRKVTVDDNITYTAYFEVIPPTTARISVMPADQGMGSTSPRGINTFNIGDTILVQAFANPGFKFVRWKETGITDEAFELPIKENATYTAVFEATEGDLCAVRAICDPVNAGKATGQGTYKRWSDCVLEAFPNDGYVFDHWLNGNTISRENPYKFPANDTICTAVFVRKDDTYWIPKYDEKRLLISNARTGDIIDLSQYSGSPTYAEFTAKGLIDKDVMKPTDVFHMAWIDEGDKISIINTKGAYPIFDNKEIEFVLIVDDDYINISSTYHLSWVEPEMRAVITKKYLGGDPYWYKGYEKEENV